MRREAPYVYVVHSPNTPVETGVFDRLGVAYKHMSGYHALFAARVVLEPYEVLTQRKRGWLERDLLDEILDRQRRFIASLHYVDPRSASPDLHLRTVALRYVARPSAEQVDVILVGKVFAPDLGQARSLASAWYEEIEALFPSDYKLLPIKSEEQFMAQSGQELLETLSSSMQTVEVRRFEMFIPRPSERDVTEGHYVVYPFAWHRDGMEQVWQVMASGTVPTIVSVVLRPAYLYEAEEIHLTRFYEAATKLVESGCAADRILGEQAAHVYAGYLRSWRHPFLVRVQIVTPLEIPGALARAVGCALSYGGTPTHSGGQGDFLFPGYELVMPEEGECKRARDNVCLLEMGDWGPDQAAVPYRRFRYLADVQGAHCAFRLPFVPKGGIPGVAFGQAIESAATSLGNG